MKSLEHIVFDILRHPETQSDPAFIAFIHKNPNHIMTLLKLVEHMQRHDQNLDQEHSQKLDQKSDEKLDQLHSQKLDEKHSQNALLIEPVSARVSPDTTSLNKAETLSSVAHQPTPSSSSLAGALDIAPESLAKKPLPQPTSSPQPALHVEQKLNTDPTQDVGLVQGLCHDQQAQMIDNVSVAIESDADLIPELSSINDPQPQGANMTSITPAPTYRFQVNNARVGQDYQAQIKVVYPEQAQIQFVADSFVFPEGLALRFDAENNRLHGTVALAQDSVFHFQFSTARQPEQILQGSCKISVIADPRSLWQINEPATESVFRKAHVDSQRIKHPQFNIVAASRRGRSHEHAGTFRDDDFSILNIAQSDWSVLCLADGAGSASYSREGARIAVENVRSLMQQFFNPAKLVELDQILAQWKIGNQGPHNNQLAQQIHAQFYQQYHLIYKTILEQIDVQALAMDCHAKQFSTTLLIAVLKHQAEQTFICTFSVGDGVIAAYSPQQIRLMNVADSGEFAGQTKFLDKSIQHDFANRIKMGYFNQIEALYLMTDGISDPKFETEQGLAEVEKWHALHQALAPIVKAEDAEQQLLEWMHFFKPGHHDDRSMIVLSDRSSAVEG
ncbi:protein phosphatase 2C-like protein [Acinetobacter calcoaceticus]|uniref:Protein phosphatase 2C-like protein n=1 Tax=Acinetobacter calcoaceticus TaxID=471 RepID=A0A4R1XSC4_ACICA|nr:protein phosphatase 2C-like protein [Acinetobacter calcoaceticus]